MGTIKLDGQTGCSATFVSNRFLDEYMPNANGEFVKIYLYLLRTFSEPDADISVCHIADVFHHTEKDIIRALKYWEQAGLLKLGFDNHKMLTHISLIPIMPEPSCGDSANISDDSDTTTETPADSQPVNQDKRTTAPAETTSVAEARREAGEASTNAAHMKTKKVYTADELAAFKTQSEVIEFLYLAEKYIGKTLSGSDINTLLYFYDVLGFEVELIEYLIEYCVTNGHKSLRYMEKVALSWAEEGIDNVEKARSNTDTYSRTCYPVLKAFGITGRNPGVEEKAFVVKWTNSYGFTMDIIVDACKRTLSATSKPSFKYADSILTKWHEKGIKNLNDVKVLDIEHQKNKLTYNQTHSNSDKNENKQKNSFNNFNQRTYNYEDLEKELLKNI